jgi:hypothetical protein
VDVKPFVLSFSEWKDLEKRIRVEHPPSVFLSREKMRRVLGFTPRTHKVWSEQRGSETTIHLDFFDDRQRTMFLLKYGNGKD